MLHSFGQRCSLLRIVVPRWHTGSGDYCPCTRLRATDVVFARADDGHDSLLRRCRDANGREAAPIAARIVEWRTAAEVVRECEALFLETLMEGGGEEVEKELARAAAATASADGMAEAADVAAAAAAQPPTGSGSVAVQRAAAATAGRTGATTDAKE